MITTRVLPPAEYWKIARDLPDAELAQVDFADLNGVVCVAEAGGTIVGVWPLILTWHAEPLYVAPGYRRQGLLTSQTVQALYQQLQQTMRDAGTTTALVVIEDPLLQQTAARLGFTLVPGQLYYATVDAPVADPAPPQRS